MINARRLYDTCFHAAVAVSQAFIAVVDCRGRRGFRALVLSAAGKPSWTGLLLRVPMQPHSVRRHRTQILLASDQRHISRIT